MRLYFKLALMVLVTCAGQAAVSSGIVRETAFAARCLAAHLSGDERLEERLIAECEDQFVLQRQRAAAQARLTRECQSKFLVEHEARVTVVALNATASF